MPDTSHPAAVPDIATGADPYRPELPLPALGDAARWLGRYTPPFEFGDFFAPEDTVLCALATAWSLERTLDASDAADAASTPAPDGPAAPPARGPRVIELTCGPGLVLFAQLDRWPALRGWGADVDPAAVERARRNAAALGLGDRARFHHLGLFDRGAAAWLARRRPDVVACNPPYVPEPPDAPNALVAGAGPDGAAHPRRALALAARAGVPRLALSWCSLGDPIGVARDAARRGYHLEALWATAIADGEWTGAALPYLRTLPTAFFSERADTRRLLAPDGAARFAYLLLAGSFARAEVPGALPAPPAGIFERRSLTRRAVEARAAGVHAVARLVRRFARRGLSGIVPDPAVSRTPPVFRYASDRWDELRMRAMAHGPA